MQSMLITPTPQIEGTGAAGVNGRRALPPEEGPEQSPHCRFAHLLSPAALQPCCVGGKTPMGAATRPGSSTICRPSPQSPLPSLLELGLQEMDDGHRTDMSDASDALWISP